MPNGLDLHGQFHTGRTWTGRVLAMDVAGFVLTLIGWITYGTLGLAWVSILQSVILLIAVFNLELMSSGIYIALRGTKDESDFMERTRYGNQTYEEIRDLWSRILSTEQEIRKLRKQATSEKPK